MCTHKQKARRHSLFKDILEDVFKSAVVGFKNGVLCAHVQGPLLANSVLEAAVCKACNRLMKGIKKQTVHEGFISWTGANNLPLIKLKVICDDLWCCKIKQTRADEGKQNSSKESWNDDRGLQRLRCAFYNSIAAYLRVQTIWGQ